MNTELINEIRQAVREELAAAPINPEFANAKYIHARFGLHRGTLLKLVEDGQVRRKKIGDPSKGQALYKVSDVAEWMYQTEGE